MMTPPKERFLKKNIQYIHVAMGVVAFNRR